MKDVDDGDFDFAGEPEDTQSYIDHTASKEEVIRQLEICPICGNQLQFSYFADFINLVTNEVVRCYECSYRARTGLKNLL